ncbi:Glycosyltransferase involved in cell wall bisynthesis [Psychrobacillus psychrotolerans]|uniref:Glycosyltransferase involved in cell wall bisynthesis n=1 Tax=Psychrobacillus psychrotolerans TaxID=126156 RepID=A0A1I6A1R6_9BACI|nr:glycosyltransferase [Psychrobacillus psychrotolerans]SFQ62598.1 Glycosyltransferase involved in cell wall bisynthesis [Psychrobacillus psychrotolerans]
MKVLWLTNISLPEACQLMNETPPPFGGWLINASIGLSSKENIKLSIAFPRSSSKDITQLHGKKINYFTFPFVDMKDKESIRNNNHLKKILKTLKPDLVHIFGTEFPHSLAMVNACNEYGIKTVITIQGLVSIISKHYTAGLPVWVQKRFTFRDFVKQNNILQQKKGFEKSGLIEIEAIQKAAHIIGRTTWDRVCTSQINSSASYYFCNETLREEFYKHEWSLESCEKYTIFLSQASYPIKGLHYMLEALPLILEKYPEAKVYIAGPDIIASSNIKERLKKSSYTKYIAELIKKNNLKKHVFFTGLLDEERMCDRFLKSNVFVSPSSIENESNSLSEAKLLGVPCVTSFVGGVIDRINNKSDGFLYQTDAPYMLAHYVCEIFGNEKLALDFSKNARKHALQTHDKEINLNSLLNIYTNIYSN